MYLVFVHSDTLTLSSTVVKVLRIAVIGHVSFGGKSWGGFVSHFYLLTFSVCSFVCFCVLL